MALLGISFLVFLTMIGLTVSAAYFFIHVRASRKQMRTRLRSIQEAAVAGPLSTESQIVREEILSSIPAINRILLQVPFISRLQLFFTQAAVSLPVETLLSISAALLLFSALFF